MPGIHARCQPRCLRRFQRGCEAELHAQPPGVLSVVLLPIGTAVDCALRFPDVPQVSSGLLRYWRTLRSLFECQAVHLVQTRINLSDANFY